MNGPKLIPQPAKFIDVAWCAMDFTLILGNSGFDAGPNGLQDGGRCMSAAVSTSPIMAKALARDLAAAVEAYERAYGLIPAPPANANVVPLKAVEPEPYPCQYDPLCPNSKKGQPCCQFPVP